MHMLRGYVLHMPCRQVVRDVYIAESLYPTRCPRVSFSFPARAPPCGRRATDGSRHFTEVDLTTLDRAAPAGPPSYTIPGVMNHGAAVRHVLERTGHGADALPRLALGDDLPGASGRDDVVAVPPLVPRRQHSPSRRYNGGPVDPARRSYFEMGSSPWCGAARR